MIRRIFLIIVLLVTFSAPAFADTAPAPSRGIPLDANKFRYNGSNALPTLGLDQLDEGVKEDPVAVVDSVLINFVINPIFFLAAGVAVIVVMYSAFRIITARGEEEGITAAKNTLIWAAAGLLLIMLSYTLVRNIVEIVIDNV